MPRPKGLSKTGGRVRGTPNRQNSDLACVLREFRYNPARALLEKYQQLKLEDQLKVDLRLMDYVYPRARSLEGGDSEHTQSNTVEMTAEDRGEEIQRLMAYRYKEDDLAVLGDLRMIKQLRPEVLKRFLDEAEMANLN